jgi:hypothetical protein
MYPSNYFENAKSWTFRLQLLEDRRSEQGLALVHKFLTDRTKTDLFRRIPETERARTRQAAGDQGLTVQYHTHEQMSRSTLSQ